MKFNQRFHLLYIYIILSVSITYSQRKDYKQELYVGINAGQTASMVNFDPSIEQGLLMGYNGGLVFRYIAQKSLGFQSELNFSQRGWSEKDGNYSRQLNYLELPILTHINFGNKFRFFVNLGPKVSFLLSEKVLINTTNSTSEQHSKPVYNKLDYGFSGGLGFLLNIKGQVIQLDGRANYSMSPIFSDAKRDYFDSSSNLNASVNIAWLFQVL